MKVNSSKSHLVMSGKQRVTAEIGKNELESQDVEELLGTDINSSLTLK